jgi:phenylacetate-CoA ligase
MIDEGLLFPRVHRLYREQRPPLVIHDALDRMLRHAVTNVPAYRVLGLAADDHRSPWDLLAAFPLVDRHALQKSLADFCDDHLDPAECRAGTTSGTSGVPIKVIHDLDHHVFEAVLALRRMERRGLPLRRRILMPMKTMPLPWVEYTSPLMWHSIVAEFGTTESSDLAALAHRSECFRPDVVFGHPSDCVTFAELVADHRSDIRPKVVQTYGEYLSAANRDRLAKVFHADVFDSYGLYEFGTVAVECVERRYHVIPEKVYLEIVDNQGKPMPEGEVGEIVITGLSNRAMPLIRYRTFDRGAVVAGRCPCGIGGQMISQLEGRTVGQVTLSNGRTVRADALTRILRHQHLQRFQTIVDAPDRVEVRIHRGGGPVEATTQDRLRDQLREVLGEEVALVINEVGPDGFISEGRRKHVDLIVST